MSRLNFEKIAKHAKENRWSAPAVAEKCGLSAATVLKVFKGDSVPSAVNLKAICDVIGLSVEEVFVEAEAASN